jgi:hypothetical protein
MVVPRFGGSNCDAYVTYLFGYLFLVQFKSVMEISAAPARDHFMTNR